MTNKQRDMFLKACAMLATLTGAYGFRVYVSGSGSVHLMTGPSHEGVDARPRRDRIVASAVVPRMSGGDW